MEKSQTIIKNTTRIFSAQNRQKKGIFSLGRKNNILIEECVVMGFGKYTSTYAR